MLRALYRSASLRAAAALGLSGVAFALGNLILARVLPSQEYGLVSLFIGVVAVSGVMAPLGLDVVVGRRGLRLDPRWRRATLAACTATGLATAALAAVAYRLEVFLLVCVLITTIAAGLTWSGTAYFQGQRRLGLAAWTSQLSNWQLVPVAVISALLGHVTAAAPCVLITGAGVIAASAVWLHLVRREAAVAPQPDPGELLSEALSLVLIQTSSAAFLQLERLLIAPTVGVHDLAVFGVLATLVGSPFRMLQGGVQLTLIPGLRATGSGRERLRLVRHEALLLTIAMAGGSLVIWLLAPPIAHWFLSGRYDLSAALMTAAIVSGVLKVVSAFTLAIVVAVAQEGDLRVLSVISWASSGLSIIAAFAAAQWGLVGVLYGISSGWLIRSVLAAWMAMPHLRQGASTAAVSAPAGGGRHSGGAKLASDALTKTRRRPPCAPDALTPPHVADQPSTDP